MGVVVRRYIDILTIIINFPYSTCISSFFGSSIIIYSLLMGIIGTTAPMSIFSMYKNIGLPHTLTNNTRV